MGGQSQSCDLEIRLHLIGDYLNVAFIASFYGATVDNVKVSSSQTSNLKLLGYDTYEQHKSCGKTYMLGFILIAHNQIISLGCIHFVACPP